MMKCLKCQFENPEEIQFCVECGNKLVLSCPECGFENSPTFKFCGQCGGNLVLSFEQSPKYLSFHEQLSKIQKYLPEGIAEKVLSQRNRIEGERKHVTVLFCDIAGFTPLTEKLGPEETFSLMDQIYEILIHKVNEYEGTVNELTGDGILALFGAPIALEDAPQRALRSALAIHREISAFNEKVRSDGKIKIPPILLRIGINSGPVVVGVLGNDLRVQFSAVGDTINMAARIEGLAEPGTTYVTADTFKLAEGFFRFEALGSKQIKGKTKPLELYRVIAPSSSRTRFDVSTESGLTPFVGRQRELKLLLDGFKRSKEGRGQAFSIISEAGVGKSRLLYEFRKAVSNENITFLEGKCLSYSRNQSYHPLIDILKSNFDIRDGDKSSDITGKVKKGLNVLGADETSTLPYLLELLSIKYSGLDKIPISPEAVRDGIIEALKRIAFLGSKIRPLIIALEDLHWMDKSSEDISKYLIESIAESRVLLIFNYRPEFEPTCSSKSFHHQLTLNRLSTRESLTMVSHRLGEAKVDDDLEKLILEKTEGVPFFIEEFIRSLGDFNMIEKKTGEYRLADSTRRLALPSTIQDIIMARVDNLPAASKSVLQIGSVIEREFSFELINRMTDAQEKDLLACLSVLTNSELIYERGIYPETTYVFKHALTREVVYDSILSKRLKKIHEAVGNAIEHLHQDSLDEHHAVLARHFIASENFEKGAQYSWLARKKAEKMRSYREAIYHSRRILKCLQKLKQTIDIQKKIISTKTKIGFYYSEMALFDKAMNEVSHLTDLARDLSYKKPLPQIYVILGTYSYFIKEDFPTAIKDLKKSIKIAEELMDVPSLVMGITWLAIAHAFCCDFRSAQLYFEKSLEIRGLQNWGVAHGKSGLSIFVYNWQGEIERAFKTSREAHRIAQIEGDMFSKSNANFGLGCSNYHKGFLVEAENLLWSACHFFEVEHIVSWWAFAYLYLGLIKFDMQDYENSIKFHNLSLSLFQSAKIFPSFHNFNQLAILRAKVFQNQEDTDLSNLSQYVANNQFKIYEGWIPHLIAEILLKQKETKLFEAEDWIKKAIDANQRNGMKWLLARDYTVFAEIFKRRDEKRNAQENFKKALEILKECGADGWVERVENDMLRLS